MRSVREAGILLLLLASVLPGCVDDTDDDAATVPDEPTWQPTKPVQVIDDAAGDAYLYNSFWLAGMQPCPLIFRPQEVPPTVPEVQAPCNPLGELPIYASREPTGAVPATPERDVLGVTMEETPSTIEVHMQIARLTPDFAGAIERDVQGRAVAGTQYGVLWVDPQTGCVKIPALDVYPAVAGIAADPFLYTNCMLIPGVELNLTAEPCRSQMCWWKSGFEIEFGEPATLHWSIPRREFASTRAGDVVAEPQAFSFASPVQQDLATSGVEVTGPVAFPYVRSPASQYYMVDASPPGSDFTFANEPVWDSPSGFSIHLDSAVTVPTPGLDPQHQLEGADYEDLGSHFRVTVVLEQVEERAPAHRLLVELGLTGFDAIVGYSTVDGERVPFATATLPDGSEVGFPVTIQTHYGSPGSIVYTVARNDLPPIDPFGYSTGLWAATVDTRYDQHAVGDTSVSNFTWVMYDYLESSPSLKVPPGEPSLQTAAGRFVDPFNDVARPQDLVATPSTRFDLTGVEIVSKAPGEVRINLGVRDLSDLDDRGSYDGVFYVVGIESEKGQTMLGYYRGNDAPSGKFLCAPDTTVFQTPPGDPAVSLEETNILGRVVTAAGGGKGGGDTSASAAFLMFAPAFCFGLEDDASHLNITSLRAASYLIRRQPSTPSSPASPFLQGDVEQLDSMDATNFSVAFATVAPPAGPSFWDAPFGLEEFWNIVGAALAIITVLGTFIVFLRRRNIMKRYLVELARIERTHLTQPDIRAQALVALRRRLHRDIVKHRVSDSQYIMDRLRSSITSARLVTIGESFYDLPTPLALRIERLLDDGRLTAEEEQSLLGPLIMKANLPMKVRNRLTQRLRTWVLEDAGVGGE